MKLALVFGVAAVLSGLGLATSVDAALHDFCVNPVADAPNSWNQAGALAANNCLGEMLVGLDPDDWYFVNVPLSTSSATLSVTVCPTITKTGPWNPNLSLHFLPLGSALVVPALPSVITITPDPTGGLVAPPLVGSSNNAAGCDAVTATQTLANGGRWLIDIDRASGDGFYVLTVV